MNTQSSDTLILGQGLAGSLLAWQLIQSGQRVMLIDQGEPLSASRMAAGLINPVTGKRLVKSKQVDIFLPQALSLYRELERNFGITFFHEKDMTRRFNSAEEIPAWEKRKHDPAYRTYLGERTQANSHPYIHDPLGGFRQLQTGYLDTVALLDCLDNYFKQHNASSCNTVKYEDIRIETDGVHIQDLDARQLVFCEGYRAINNPWFNWLPFKLAKGEILTLQSETQPANEIINAGKWLLPLDHGLFKLGATYQWHELNELPTESARQELLETAMKLLRQDEAPTIVRHQAGIRPCTKDTMPFIGRHPEQPRLSIFNGFGSKGSLMIPYYCQQFASLLQGKPVNIEEADINRYWHHDH